MSSRGGRPRRVYLGRHLMVKGKYIPTILQREKTTTIRWGIVIPKYKEIIIHGGGHVIGKAIIEDVEYKKVKDLTHKDAIRDGFSSKAELLNELKSMYPKIKKNDYVTIIRFRLVKLAENEDEAAIYHGFRPADIARIALRYEIPLSKEEREILRLLTKAGSLRRAAKELGGLEKRRLVRRVIRKALDLLLKQGILSSDSSDQP